jgi:hypothetical protein
MSQALAAGLKGMRAPGTGHEPGRTGGGFGRDAKDLPQVCAWLDGGKVPEQGA